MIQQRASHAVGPTPGVIGPPLQQTRGRRVLIVDDELPIRMLLTRRLRAWGYGVQHVGGAVEALDIMSTSPADIVICDVAMPDHDGLWLIERIHHRWPMTAIIMSTGHQDAYTVQASRKMGAMAYLQKPFTEYALREVLDRVGSAAQ